MKAATYAWSCAFLAIAGLCVELSNLSEFGVLRPGRARPRSVVACIAMRDEAANAQRCIEALLKQPEVAAVIVADDGSTDGTSAIVASLAMRDSRVAVVAASACDRRPPKNRALAAAAEAARSTPHRYLLFTDADVRLQPGAIGGAILALRARRAQAISAWPRIERSSAWDGFFAPLVAGLLTHVLPMRAARVADPRFAAANGQFFVIEKQAYERSGGHAALDAIVEDVGLAKALKRTGARVVLASAADVAVTGGYGSLRANLHGYGRSLFFGAGPWGCIAYGFWQWSAFVAPWLLLVRVPAPAVAAAAASLASRALLTRWTGEPLHAFLRAPLEGLCGATGGFAAAWIGRRGRFRWRGRRLERGQG